MRIRCRFPTPTRRLRAWTPTRCAPSSSHAFTGLLKANFCIIRRLFALSTKTPAKVTGFSGKGLKQAPSRCHPERRPKAGVEGSPQPGEILRLRAARSAQDDKGRKGFGYRKGGPYGTTLSGVSYVVRTRGYSAAPSPPSAFSPSAPSAPSVGCSPSALSAPSSTGCSPSSAG